MNVKKKQEKVINLAGAISKTDKSKTVYQCIDCGSDLILDLTFKLKNPHASGTGYFCGPAIRHLMMPLSDYPRNQRQ